MIRKILSARFVIFKTKPSGSTMAVTQPKRCEMSSRREFTVVNKAHECAKFCDEDVSLRVFYISLTILPISTLDHRLKSKW